jgi:hypothetical protein
MGVLEALGGWQNVNQEKLKQIKVDNPPLYDAISKALNLLAKKFGGEDIMIQKPIEVVDKKPTPIRMESDYAFLKRMEILTLTKVNAVTSNNIVRTIMNEVGLEDDISLLKNFESFVQEKLDDLEARDLVSRVAGSIYKITNAGQEYINDYELQNKQVEGLEPTDEDLKLEVLLRMSDYYNGGDYELLTQNTIIFDAYKQKWGIPPNKYFGVVVKLLQDGLVEKDPSGDTDSIRLTNKGYQKAMDWFEENSPEEGAQPTTPIAPLTEIQKQMIEMVSEEINKNGKPVDVLYEILTNGRIFTTDPVEELTEDLKYLVANQYLKSEGMVLFELDSMGTNYLNQKSKGQFPTISKPQYDLPQHRLEGVLKRLSEAMSKMNPYVTIEQLYRQLYDVVLPVSYTKYGLSGEPTLEKDFQVMERMGLIKSRKTVDPKYQTIDTEYSIDSKGSDLLTEIKLREAQQQKASSLRPSPTESATSVPVGTIRFGNDGNEYRVTMTKSGVKRWTKRGEIPSDEPEVPQEPPIPEITEDEVDLDLLEQQLNDDSLEFELNEEDLDNLEF